MSLNIQNIHEDKQNLIQQCHKLRQENCRLQKLIISYQQIIDQERKQKQTYFNKFNDLQQVFKKLQDKYNKMVKQFPNYSKLNNNHEDLLLKNSDKIQNYQSAKVLKTSAQQTNPVINNTYSKDDQNVSSKNTLVMKYLYKKKISLPTTSSFHQNDLLQTNVTIDLNQKKLLKVQKQKLGNEKNQPIKAIFEQLSSKNDGVKTTGPKLKKKLTYFQK